MSRLLHAAARGARIQMMYQRGWIPAVAVRTDDMYKYRIHPDDENLQYGPISTALRDCDGDFQWFYIEHEWQQNKDRLTRSLFLLLLAEALADEGM